MATGQVQVTAQKVGDLRVPLFASPYPAFYFIQSFVINSFDAVLEFGQGATNPPSNQIQQLMLSYLTPQQRFDTLNNELQAASGNSIGNIAFYGYQLGIVESTTGPTVTSKGAVVNDIAAGSGTIVSRHSPVPFMFNTALPFAGGIQSPNNAPTLVMVRINLSGQTIYQPFIYFSAWGTDVVHQVNQVSIFNPMQAGPPTANYLGPSIAGPTPPQVFGFEYGANSGLVYSNSGFNSASPAGFLPDLDAIINRWIFPFASPPTWHILNWLPGEKTPGGGSYNQDGYELIITFDDPAIDTAMQGATLQQAGRKGFLFKANATYKGQNPLVVFLSPDGTKYYTLLFAPQDAQSSDVMTNPTFTTDRNGIVYALKGVTGTLANSFGTSISFPQPFAGSLKPIALPCVDPCLPWPVTWPTGGL